MAKVIYAKYSNERSRKFCIRTEILEEQDKTRYVRKLPANPQAREHVSNLYKWYELFSSEKGQSAVVYNKCQKQKEAVCLEYVEAPSLETVLDSFLENAEVDKAADLFRKYLRIIQELYEKVPFVKTPRFQEVFGDARLPEGLKCALVTNIDTVCGNIVLTEPATIIDYEWTFDFPVPAGYVIYRMIHYYIDCRNIRSVLKSYNLYEEFQITPELQNTYKKMEKAFQAYITGKHVPMREMFRSITPGVGRMDFLKEERLQVYYSFGETYCEENTLNYPIKENKVAVTVVLPENVRKIRLDPGDKACAVKIRTLMFKGKKKQPDFQVPEGTTLGGWIYIGKDDPNIDGIQVPKGCTQLRVEMEIHPFNGECIRELVRDTRKLEEQNRRQKRLIEDMQNTKVWKLYQSYRKKVEKR